MQDDGVSVRKQVEAAARSLEAIASSCVGPTGMTKLLVLGTDATSGAPETKLTSSSKRFIEHGSTFVHLPFAQVIIELTKRQCEQCGDGGWRALHLASSLTKAALTTKSHHVHCSEAFSKAGVCWFVTLAAELCLKNFLTLLGFSLAMVDRMDGSGCHRRHRFCQDDTNSAGNALRESSCAEDVMERHLRGFRARGRHAWLETASRSALLHTEHAPSACQHIAQMLRGVSPRNGQCW